MKGPSVIEPNEWSNHDHRKKKKKVILVPILDEGEGLVQKSIGNAVVRNITSCNVT
jgi:hypothetical protein